MYDDLLAYKLLKSGILVNKNYEDTDIFIATLSEL